MAGLATLPNATGLRVTQGDLADPAYFDFMSFCQYATIADGMRHGQMIFEELIDANGTTIIVTRDAALPTANELLPAVHAEREQTATRAPHRLASIGLHRSTDRAFESRARTGVGERILVWAAEKFPKLAPKVPERVTAAELVDGVSKLASIFAINEL